MNKKTKIICTMGPNTNNRDLMLQLAQNGMDIARFNFSHGDYEEQKERMDLLKNVRQQVKKPIAMLLDTKGPEIRTGQLKEQKVTLTEGQKFTLTSEEIEGDETRVSISYKELVNDVAPGSRILIDDGLIGLVVDEVQETEILCTVENGGVLSSKKGVNVPNVKINLPSITEKDRNDIIPLKATGYNEDYDHNIHELVFIVGDNDDWVLNGSEEKETGIDATTLAKTFEVGLAKEVQGEDYQGANLKITVEIQAMQYRNTGSEVWDTIFTESFDISGLPSENENG